MWDLRWTKWHWDRFLSQYSSSPVSIIPSLLYTHLHQHAAVSRRNGRSLGRPPVKNVLSEIGKHSPQNHFHLCSLCKGFTGWQFGCKVVINSNTTKVVSNPARRTDVSSGGLQPDIHSFITEAVLSQKWTASLNKRLKRRETSVRAGCTAAETGAERMSGVTKILRSATSLEMCAQRNNCGQLAALCFIRSPTTTTVWKQVVSSLSLLYRTVPYRTVLYCTVLYCTTATRWQPNCS